MTTPPRQSGLTQQQRSARTRAKAIDAAIDSLHEVGFAATSTLSIQKRAGISRGRLLHQFASKDALLIAAVQRVAASRFEALGSLELIGESADRIDQAVNILWRSHWDRLFWVALELWLAARLDSDLRAALLPEERNLGRLIRRWCDDLFGEQLTARPGYQALREVLISSMRGVAATYSFDQRDMETEPMLEVWRQLATDALRPMEKAAAPPPKRPARMD